MFMIIRYWDRSRISVLFTSNLTPHKKPLMKIYRLLSFTEKYSLTPVVNESVGRYGGHILPLTTITKKIVIAIEVKKKKKKELVLVSENTG